MKVRTALLLITVASAGIIPPLVGYQVMLRVSEKEWKEVKAKAETAGVPLTIEAALDGYRPGSDSKDAAAGVREVQLRIETLAREAKNAKLSYELFQLNPAYGNTEKPDRIQRAALRFQTPLRELHRVLERPSWNTKRRWELYSPIDYGTLDPLKTLSRMLNGQALANWKTDPRQSISALKAMVRLGTHLQSEPHLECISAGSETLSTAYRTAISLAASPRTAPQLRSELLKVIALPIPAVDWRRCWRLQLAAQLRQMELFASHAGLEQLEFGSESPRSVRTLNIARSDMLRSMIDAEADLKNGPKDPKTMRAVANSYFSGLEDIATRYSYQIGWYSSGDGYQEAVNEFETSEAYRRLAFLAIKMSARPGKSSTLPAEAGRPEWSDPFSGKPMLLKRSTAGFFLYSVGPNLIDDGGSAGSRYGSVPDLIAASS